MDFGDKVRALREARGLSTTELAKLADLSQSFISDIENKRRMSPTGKTLSKLAKALKVSPAYFLDEDIRTPFDVLESIPDHLKDFMLNLENMPYLKLSHEAKEKGISPEMMQHLMGVLLESMKDKRLKP